MVDRGAGSVGIERHHLAGDVTADVERVAPRAAVQDGHHAGRRGQDEEVVVATETVDLDLLDVGVGDEQTGALHPVLADHEVVVGLGADHDHRVEARAAVDAHRGVDVVGDVVVAGTAVDQGLRRPRLGRVGGKQEGADVERVVPGLAEQLQGGLVAVDAEGVVAGAAVHGGRVADAAREPVVDRRLVVLGNLLGRVELDLLGGDRVAWGHGRQGRGAVGAEQLAELEEIVARTTVDRGQRAVVVDVELIVAAAPDHVQQVDRGVVVDPLVLQREGARGPIGDAARGLARAVHEGDEVLAQQEHVGELRHAVDDHRVDVGGKPGVVHVDDVVGAGRIASRRPGHVHRVRVRAGAAVDVDHVARRQVGNLQDRPVHPGQRRLGGGAVDESPGAAGAAARAARGVELVGQVDGRELQRDRVRPRATGDERVAVQRDRLQQDGDAAVARVGLDQRSGEGAQQDDRAAGEIVPAAAHDRVPVSAHRGERIDRQVAPGLDRRVER